MIKRNKESVMMPHVNNMKMKMRMIFVNVGL